MESECGMLTLTFPSPHSNSFPSRPKVRPIFRARDPRMIAATTVRVFQWSVTYLRAKFDVFVLLLLLLFPARLLLPVAFEESWPTYVWSVRMSCLRCGGA